MFAICSCSGRTATGESGFSFSTLFQISCLYPSVAECDLEVNGKNNSGKYSLLPCDAKQNLERGSDDMELTTDNLTKWTQGKSRQAYLEEDLGGEKEDVRKNVNGKKKESSRKNFSWKQSM